jgi:hypothetical protein
VLSLALTQLRFDSLPKSRPPPAGPPFASPALPEVATTNVIKRHRNAYSELTGAYERFDFLNGQVNIEMKQLLHLFDQYRR